MNTLLAVIDMQNDFITGTLGTDGAKAVVGSVTKLIENFDGEIVFTRDTHYENYDDTQEGKNLPVKHCIYNTSGWEICEEIKSLSVYKKSRIFDKLTFGSTELAQYVKEKAFDEVILAGVCTDICVISNALVIKAFAPEVKITVVSSCCAGVTPESHQTALDAMKMCQIGIKQVI